MNEFVIGISVNLKISESENLEQQSNGQYSDFGRIDKSARQNQVIEEYIDNQITRAVNSTVMTVESCLHDLTLTAIDNVVIPRVEMVVKSISDPAGQGTGSEVQNPDRRDFVGNIKNTPLMSASSHLDLDNELNRNDEIRNAVDFEDSDFAALKSNYDRREHAHHSYINATFSNCFS